MSRHSSHPPRRRHHCCGRMPTPPPPLWAVTTMRRHRLTTSAFFHPYAPPPCCCHYATPTAPTAVAYRRLRAPPSSMSAPANTPSPFLSLLGRQPTSYTVVTL
ncbi:hypothetical protein L1987_63718 [Smallanthus sonchifolius]|uniref:Uncharacterized protein n=1 Tax=Smallanthus sonchifolius TaxID=185202 RepID=A0ACB9CEB5_9ASTR|nr:hypothetical protein L1987_63718 [Smallanthus sonchifolius]